MGSNRLLLRAAIGHAAAPPPLGCWGRWVPVAHVVGTTHLPGVGGGNRQEAVQDSS